MGYLVETSGRILLPESLERQALTVLEVRMAGRQGWYDEDEVHVDSLEELAPFAAAQVRREGDWLVLGTDTDGDPKWSEQAGEFYRSLGSFVREGEVHLQGEDGQTWSYVYSGDGVEQRGDNGWDGTPGTGPPAGAGPVVPAAAPAESPMPPAPPAPPAGAATPPGVTPVPPGGPAPEAPEPSQFRYPGSDQRPEPTTGPTPPAGPTPGPPPGAYEPPYSPAPGQPGPGQPPGPGVPDYRAERAWAEPPPASTGRTVLMATLLVVGVVLIIGLALLVSGF